MTLPLSGPLGLEAIKFEAVGGVTPTKPYSINSPDIRALAEINTPESEIKFFDFYGKGKYSDHIVSADPYTGPWDGQIVYSTPEYLLAVPTTPLRGGLQNTLYKGWGITHILLGSVSPPLFPVFRFAVKGAHSLLTVKNIEWITNTGMQSRWYNPTAVVYPATDTYEAYTLFQGGTQFAALDWVPSVTLSDKQAQLRIYW